VDGLLKVMTLSENPLRHLLRWKRRKEEKEKKEWKKKM
jgi:hypothetical protein